MVRTQIESVVGRVLRNEIQFLDSLSNQPARLGNDIGLRPAPMRAAHAGNDAKTAGMIAAFGNFEISKMAGRETEARRRVIRNIGRPRIHLDQWNGRTGNDA